jgi:hypothetical protein
LLGQVRCDLDTLTTKLAAADRDWAASRGRNPPPQHIAHYIHDHRCCLGDASTGVITAPHTNLARRYLALSSRSIPDGCCPARVD